MKVLAIDPGFTLTGVCVGEFDGTHFSIEKLATIPSDPSLPQWARISGIMVDIVSTIDYKEQNTCLTIIEDCVMGRNVNSMKMQSELIGVMWNYFGREDSIRVNPIHVKQYFTGNSKSKKDAMIKEAERFFNITLEGTKPEKEAQADAIAVAWAGLCKRIEDDQS